MPKIHTDGKKFLECKGFNNVFFRVYYSRVNECVRFCYSPYIVNPNGIPQQSVKEVIKDPCFLGCLSQQCTPRLNFFHFGYKMNEWGFNVQ
jgi:hypothetical protein